MATDITAYRDAEPPSGRRPGGGPWPSTTSACPRRAPPYGSKRSGRDRRCSSSTAHPTPGLPGCRWSNTSTGYGAAAGRPARNGAFRAIPDYRVEPAPSRCPVRAARSSTRSTSPGRTWSDPPSAAIWRRGPPPSTPTDSSAWCRWRHPRWSPETRSRRSCDCWRVRASGGSSTYCRRTNAAARAIFRQIGHRASLDAGRIPQALFDWYLALQRHTDTIRNDGERIGDGIPRWDEFRLTDDLLAGIPVPTMFWWRAQDTFGGEAVARHLVEVMPDARLTMVPDTGHLPWLDDPAAAAAATSAFFRGKVTQPGPR